MREFYRPTFILARTATGGKARPAASRASTSPRPCAAATTCSTTTGATRWLPASLSSRADSTPFVSGSTRLPARSSLRHVPASETRCRGPFRDDPRPCRGNGNLEPLGQGNPEIQLLIPDLNLSSPVYRMGKDRQQRNSCTDERGSCEVIAWNLKPEDEPKDHFDRRGPPGQRLQRPPPSSS